jgi:hypothetical protein
LRFKAGGSGQDEAGDQLFNGHIRPDRIIRDHPLTLEEEIICDFCAVICEKVLTILQITAR